MTDEHESAWGAGSSDAELIAAVRLGATDAFGVLYQRHATAARTVAGQYLRSTGEADDAVADAFTKVLAILSAGGGPDIAFRAYLFTVVRRLAYEMVNGARRTQPTDDMAAFESALGPLASTEEPALRGFERTTVAQAFQSLPERWQSVLWYSEVEGLAPAAIAPILGLTANGAAALAYRAREGLREAYLQQHLSSVPADECQRANALLGSFVRGGLAKRETAVVEHHLEDCSECRALVLELGDVSHGMRAVIAPLVLGLAGAGLVGTALPTWGAAAGAATGLTATGLATVPAGAAGGGPGAGAAGGSTGGTSAGAGGSAAAGGTAAGGTAAGAATAGGLAAMVAAAPALVLGIAAVVVVAAGIGVAALIGVIGGDDDPVADPAASSASADPQDGDTDSQGADDDGADVPTADPSDPTTIPTVPDGTDADDDTADEPGTDDGTSSATPRTTTPRPATPTVPPTVVTPEDTAPAPVDPAPVDPAPVDPTPVDPAPVDPTPVDPTPPDVRLNLGADLTLIPGQGNSLQLSIENSGLSAVADVGLELTLPSGLAFVPDGSSPGGVFGPRTAMVRAGDWTCLATGAVDATAATTVRCDLTEMEPGLADPLTLTVFAERSTGPVRITAQLYVGTEPVGGPETLECEVALEPARLDVGVMPVAELVAGRPGHLAVSASNLGQEPATGASVDVPLPAGSGVTWRAAGGVVHPSAGSSDGWTCSVSTSGGSVASCTTTGEIVGDASSTLLLPVDVAVGATFEGDMVPVVGHDAAPERPSTPRPLTVVARGLSAAALLEGPLQTAQVSGGVSEAVALRVPVGATVRHAEVVWSGSDAEGMPADALASMELRGDAGGPATLSLAGTAVTLDPPGEGYWAASDVTSVLAAHATSGRWALAPAAGIMAPTDLRWSLTVVYDVAGQPTSSVAVLSGPPSIGVTSAERTLVLPADGPVKVAATAVGRADAPARLLANGAVLPVVGGSDVVTYRSSNLLPPTVGSAAPLALSLMLPAGASGALDAVVVHSSSDLSAAGPLDQVEGAVDPGIGLEAVQFEGAGFVYWVGLRNRSGVDLAATTVTFGHSGDSVSFTGPACTWSGASVTCPVGPLGAGQRRELPLLLLTTAAAIDSGGFAYSVTGTDPLTGVPFVSDGVIVRAQG